MIPEPIIYQASAIIAASGMVGGAVEARRTRQAVQQHDRTLYGTEHRPGLVSKVKRLMRREDDHA